MIALLITTAFFVSTSAEPNGNGSRSRPFRDPAAAIHAARATSGDREVVFMKGVYALEQPLRLTQEDDGLSLKAEKSFAAILSGSKRITGWKVEKGTKFWYVDIPEAANDHWYFRSLLVNGKDAKRAEFPGKGVWLQNTRQWKVAWLNGVGGGWERKPTKEELLTMPTKKGDLPTDLDCDSAEMRVLHSWSDSLVRVASFDKINSVVTFRSPTKAPAGAFHQHGYAVYNIPQGMTEPGEWYLDAKCGRLHYWPKDGEKLENCEFKVPRLERLIDIDGASNIKISGLILEESAQPDGGGPGFGGAGLPGLITCKGIANCRFQKIMFRNSGGAGLSIRQGKDCIVSECGFKETGSCAIDAWGDRLKICNNRIKTAGVGYRSSSAISIVGNNHLISKNDISGAPYCGVNFSGSGNVFEENRVSKVMQVLNDGGAFYGGADSRECIIRGNRVFDIVASRKGAGCSAYYFDEGSINDQVISNWTEGVALPINNHMARGLVIKGNVFCQANGDLQLAFARCNGCDFSDNEIRVMGDIKLPPASVFANWSGNRRFKYAPMDMRPTGNFKQITLDAGENPSLRTDALAVEKALGAISVGAKFNPEAWPGTWKDDMKRTPEQKPIDGAPIWIRAARDDEHLYLCVRVAQFSYESIAAGHDERNSDWVAFVFRNRRYVVYGDGTSALKQAYAGYEDGFSSGFGKRVMYMVKIPFSELGYDTEPKEGSQVPFNCQVHIAAYNETRCWEGTVKGNPVAGMLLIK